MLVFWVGTVLIVWFFVWISAPRKKSNNAPHVVSSHIEKWTDDGEEYRFKVDVMSDGSRISYDADTQTAAEYIETQKSRDENPYAKTDIPLPDYLKQPNSFEIKIRFSEHKGTKFEELKKQYPHLLKDNDGKYTLALSYNNLPETKHIFDITKSWADSEFYVGGDNIDKKGLSKILQCLTNKEKNGGPCWCDKKEDFGYCTTLACRRIDISFGLVGNWTNYIIEQANGFLVNREKLQEILQEQGEIFRHCPHFRSQYAWERFLKIPIAISFNDKRWLCLKYKTGEIEAQPRNPKESLKKIMSYTHTDDIEKVLSKK